MANLKYWYTGQFRSYLTQFIRMFSGFHVKTGKGKDGVETYIKVPIRYADMSRQVASILKDNSSNVMLTCPFMTAHITGINQADDRRQNPNHISTIQVSERIYEDDHYGSEMGQAYTVERYMPTPYNLTIELDIWTSNTDQKLQILEQILVLFNPSLDLQISDNPIDWSSLTFVQLQDSISWSDRSIPQGTDDQPDVAKLTFLLPIWLNPPAKVKKQKIIQQIVTNITHQDIEERNDGEVIDWILSSTNKDTRVIISPKQNNIRIIGDEIVLLTYAGNEVDQYGKKLSWGSLLDEYNGDAETCKLYIRTSSELDNFNNNIIGSIKINKDEPNKLTWIIDTETLPTPTLPDIDAIISPEKNYNGKGFTAVEGMRLLILSDIAPCMAWGNLTAHAHDIIEYNNSEWSVKFDSTIDHDIDHIVRNNHSEKLFKFSNGIWIDLIDGEYYPGYWRIVS